MDRGDYVNAVINTLDKVRDLARFVDVFCDEGAFTVEETRSILREASGRGLGLRLHADEIATLGVAA